MRYQTYRQGFAPRVEWGSQLTNPMKTASKLSNVSTLALAYRNGSNYVLNGQTYANLPKGEGQLYRITETGQLVPISEVEADELARMEYLDRLTPPQGAREIPTE